MIGGVEGVAKPGWTAGARSATGRSIGVRSTGARAVGVRAGGVRGGALAGAVDTGAGVGVRTGAGAGVGAGVGRMMTDGRVCVAEGGAINPSGGPCTALEGAGVGAGAGAGEGLAMVAIAGPLSPASSSRAVIDRWAGGKDKVGIGSRKGLGWGLRWASAPPP